MDQILYLRVEKEVQVEDIEVLNRKIKEVENDIFPCREKLKYQDQEEELNLKNSNIEIIEAKNSEKNE